MVLSAGGGPLDNPPIRCPVEQVKPGRVVAKTHTGPIRRRLAPKVPQTQARSATLHVEFYLSPELLDTTHDPVDRRRLGGAIRKERQMLRPQPDDHLAFSMAMGGRQGNRGSIGRADAAVASGAGDEIHCRRPDESRHEPVRRTIIEFERRADLHDLAGIQDSDAIRQCYGFHLSCVT